jgi:hypothetical protein
MQCSSKTPLYKMSRTHCNIDSVMNSNMCWNYIILYVQIKSGIPRITFKGNTVTLNAMNSYFNPFSDDDADMCKLCSMSVPETVFHLLFECPSYLYIRTNILSSFYIPKSQIDLYCNFATFNSNYLKHLYLFLEKALKEREDWINNYE